MTGKTAFIYNPVAGNKSARDGIAAIKSFARTNGCEFLSTEYRGHASSLANSLGKEYQNIIVAGGDGTINEVASVLMNTSTNLGIVPIGSGNGLAHHLGIPTTPNQALELLHKDPRKIDIIAVNESIIVNVGGIGFDGHIAYHFNNSINRGKIAYMKLILSEVSKFKEFNYTISLDGSTKSGKAFIIAITNGSEVGNRFKIDPQAKVDNGEFGIVVIRKPPLVKLPRLLLAGYRGTLKPSPYYERFTATQAIIQQSNSLLHCDGEVNEGKPNEEFTIRILPSTLNVIY